MVNIQTHKIIIQVMMRLLETMNIIYNIEFIKVNIIYKSILKLGLLFQTLQLIAKRPIASIY